MSTARVSPLSIELLSEGSVSAIVPEGRCGARDSRGFRATRVQRCRRIGDLVDIVAVSQGVPGSMNKGSASSRSSYSWTVLAQNLRPYSERMCSGNPFLMNSSASVSMTSM